MTSALRTPFLAYPQSRRILEAFLGKFGEHQPGASTLTTSRRLGEPASVDP